MPDPVLVRGMFGRIAGRYDLLNRVLSLGIDQRWRRAAVRAAGELPGEPPRDLRGAVAVDVCCGTGDLALALGAEGARVLGVDFTPQMLRRAVAKAGRGDGRFVEGDALRLPVADGAADVATIAFGLRNVADRRAGLAELGRVVRPGGRVLVLEFSQPRGRLFGALYRFYFTRVLPRIGGGVSGDGGAYRYLPDTVLAWPSPDDLRREMEASGLVGCGWRALTGGIAVLSWGDVPHA